MIGRLRSVLSDRLSGFGLSADELLARDVSGLGEPGRVSANRSCRLIRAQDNWLALNLARPEDLDVIPAFTEGEGDGWDAIEQYFEGRKSANLLARAVDLQLPIGILAEAKYQPLANYGRRAMPRKVVDMSALWAGPLCAGLLAQSGAEVLRIESKGRPDPTRFASPSHYERLNAGKTIRELDLRVPEHLSALVAEIRKADVLVTSARPAALLRLGLDPQDFRDLRWVAITAHGFNGEGATRVGFGDDCAIAGGLIDGSLTDPSFAGDALADPISGLEAALSVLAGEEGLIDIAMSRVAAAYAGLVR